MSLFQKMKKKFLQSNFFFFPFFKEQELVLFVFFKNSE